jgi:UrcA family protein
MRHVTQKAAIHCSLLLGLFASMSVSAAEPESQFPAARVSLAGLDLAHRQGIELLYTRIRSAARQVCEPVAASAPYRFAQLDEQSCVNRAIAGAVAKVNSPLLTAVYHGDTSSTIMIAQK